MTGIRATARVLGSLFDVSALQALSGEGCSLLVVSDRTLYLMERFALNEVNFLARYVEQYVGPDGYIPVTLASPDLDFVEDTARIFRLEVGDMSCDIVGAINSLTSAIVAVSCGCEVGQGEDTDDGERGGAVPGPIGDIIYQEPAPVIDRDCKSANLVHFTLKDLFTELDRFNVDDMSTLGLVLVIGTVSGIIASVVATPMIGIIVGVAGAIAAFAARLIGVSISLANIVLAMTTGEEDLVCALFASSLASTAKADYLAQLQASGATAAEAALVGLLMTNAVLDILYFDTADTAAFWPTYVAPVDCSGCTGFERVELLPIAGGGDAGVIVGSNRFEVGDTVIITSVDETVECPGRELAAFNMLTASDLALHANVTVTIAGWTDFCVHSGCVTNLTIWSDKLDFGAPVQTIACSVEPDGVFPDISSMAPRSDTSMTITLFRTA